MKGTRKAKIFVDLAMAVTFVATMATAIVEEAPHEYLGVALFALVIAHIVLNRRWLAALPRMRHNALLVAQVVTLVLLVACIVGQVASSLVLSRYAFGFLPALPGASWARRVHMLCAYWSFVAAFAHAGLHIQVPAHADVRKLRIMRVALAVVSCYGVYSFVQLGMAGYLMGQVQFAMVDYGTPLALSFARYASVAVLVASVAYVAHEALFQPHARVSGGRRH